MHARLATRSATPFQTLSTPISLCNTGSSSPRTAWSTANAALCPSPRNCNAYANTRRTLREALLHMKTSRRIQTTSFKTASLGGRGPFFPPKVPRAASIRSAIKTTLPCISLFSFLVLHWAAYPPAGPCSPSGRWRSRIWLRSQIGQWTRVKICSSWQI